MNVLKKVKEWLNTGNNSLWVAIAAMVLIGTTSIYQLAPFQEMRMGLSEEFFFHRYVPYLIFGLIMMIGCSRMSKKIMIWFSYILGVFGYFLMLLTMVEPHIIYGTARYVSLFGVVNIDPFMLTLPAYIVLISNWLSKEITKEKKFKIWLGCSAVTVFIMYTAIMAPYMMMAAAYALAFFVMTTQSRKNMPMAFYTSIALGLGLFATFSYSVLTNSYMHARLEHIMYGTSYTVQAAKAVMHSSSLIGSNPESIQAITNLPEVHTDFMFAGIVGKMGYLMGVLVLLLYVWTSTCIIKTTHNASRFRRLLGFGVFAVFVLNFFGNIDTSIGGLQHASYLPFMSCTWNELLAFCIMFGFLLSKPEQK